MEAVKRIERCRTCGSDHLISIIHLGNQAIAGIFPKVIGEKTMFVPLELIICDECKLVQLRHSVARNLLYGGMYGYRSGINATMRNHLKKIVKKATSIVKLKRGDSVLDIGSNDGTLLKNYNARIARIGIDPGGDSYMDFYTDMMMYKGFFNHKLVKKINGKFKAKIITSIAVLYDVEDPFEFMGNVRSCLDKDGIWITEQSYLPTMLQNNSFDTICHEHLTYFSLSQIKWMTDIIGLKIIDIEFNDINGGSFRITLSHLESKYKPHTRKINKILKDEEILHTVKPFNRFRDNIYRIREDLRNLIDKLTKEKKIIFGYGASTKGNVILQFCGLNSSDIYRIADRNPEKYGRFTPSTNIEIVSEEKARMINPHYYLVLPWSFKKEFIKREAKYLREGGHFIFPLPIVEVV